jgi:hypothetical protein
VPCQLPGPGYLTRPPGPSGPASARVPLASLTHTAAGRELDLAKASAGVDLLLRLDQVGGEAGVHVLGDVAVGPEWSEGNGGPGTGGAGSVGVPVVDSDDRRSPDGTFGSSSTRSRHGTTVGCDACSLQSCREASRAAFCSPRTLIADGVARFQRNSALSPLRRVWCTLHTGRRRPDRDGRLTIIIILAVA